MSIRLRAPVQGEHLGRRVSIPPGSISWEEHELAWSAYDKKFHTGQSAERIAERGGFGYVELVLFLGAKPSTWESL